MPILGKFPLVSDVGWRGLAKKSAIAIVVVGAFVVGAIAAHVAVLYRDLPDLRRMEDYRPPVTSRVFDGNGNLVARFFEERRTLVPIDRIPQQVRNAFVAAEDEDFYTHGGIDYVAVVRAILTEVKTKIFGGARIGGSTITQQTAKTFLLTPERTYSRKVKEMLLAKKIEETFKKDEILYLYLSQIYFGNGAYGVEEAARTYYGVGVEKLTLGQAAVLASVPKSPNRINPFADPARVRERRGYVLRQMVKNNLATEAQAAKANEEPVRVQVEPPEYLDSAPYYAEAIRQILVKRYSDEEVNRGGLTVYAALDGRLQKAANEAMRGGLRDVDKRQGYRGPLLRLDPDEAKELIDALEEERARRFPPKETPELARAVDVGRPIWDLGQLTAAAVQRALSGGGRPDEEELHDEEDADTRAADKATRASEARALRTVKLTRLKIGDIVGAVVKRADAVEKLAVVDLGTTDAVLPMSTMTWARPFSPAKNTERPKNPGDVLRKGDVVLVRIVAITAAKGGKGPAKVEVALDQEPQVEGAFIAIEPSTHRVLALVGGYDFARSSFNRATQARRQPGSSFKPFVYASAIESRLFTPVGFLETHGDVVSHRLITDAPKVFFDRWTGQRWQPNNSGGRFLGDITLRTCLTHSVNTCSITLLETVGPDPVLELARKVNLHSDANPLPKNLTLALGTGEVIPLDLVDAYTIFANDGEFAPPVLIQKVKKADGQVLEEVTAAPTQVLSPQAAYMTTDMMTSVVESGTAMKARELGRPVAGKTGTTDEARSVWFVGFTPDLVAGAYVGFDDNTPLGRNESGGRAAVPIWLSFMKEATREQPVRDFVPPTGVSRRSIDSVTGLLVGLPGVDPGSLPLPTLTEEGGDPIPTELPKGVISEVFLAGTEPSLTSEDAPPPPLEVMEQGGLAP